MGEHVAQQRHDDEGLLENAEDGPHLIDRLEALRHPCRPPDEHLVAVLGVVFGVDEGSAAGGDELVHLRPTALGQRHPIRHELGEGTIGEVLLQEAAGGVDVVVGCGGIQVDGVLLDDPVGEHDDEEPRVRREANVSELCI